MDILTVIKFLCVGTVAGALFSMLITQTSENLRRLREVIINGGRK